jgi:hypothetical protein
VGRGSPSSWELFASQCPDDSGISFSGMLDRFPKKFGMTHRCAQQGLFAPTNRGNVLLLFRFSHLAILKGEVYFLLFINLIQDDIHKTRENIKTPSILIQLLYFHFKSKIRS